MKTILTILTLIIFCLTAEAQPKPSVFRNDCNYEVNPYMNKIEPSGYVGIFVTVGTFVTVNETAKYVTTQQRNRIALSCIAVSSIVYLTVLIIESK